MGVGAEQQLGTDTGHWSTVNLLSVSHATLIGSQVIFIKLSVDSFS